MNVLPQLLDAVYLFFIFLLPFHFKNLNILYWSIFVHGIPSYIFHLSAKIIHPFLYATPYLTTSHNILIVAFLKTLPDNSHIYIIVMSCFHNRSIFDKVFSLFFFGVFDTFPLNDTHQK